MTTDIYLYTLVFDKTTESLINSLENIQDEDWNGNNGEDYVSEQAIKEGYKSDLEYTIHSLHEKYDDREFNGEIMNSIIFEYIDNFISSSDYYDNFEYEDVEVGDSIVVSVALVHEW